MKKLFTLLLALVMVVGCFGGAFAEEPKTLVLDGAPSTQFAYTFNNIGGLANSLLFSGLFKTNTDMNEVYRDLCTDYTVSKDLLTYTFTLREDVKWHDGEAFDAQDVKFNLELIPKLAVINSIYANAVKAIEGYDAYVAGEAEGLSGVTFEGNVVTVKLSRVYGAFLNVIAQWMMLPEHLLKDADPLTAHNAEFWQNPVGTGAFKVSEVEWGNYAILEQNADYYGEKPIIERIKLASAADYVVACQAGEVDYFSTNSPDVLAEIEKIEGYEIYPVDTYFMRYFILNIDSPEGVNPRTSDVRIREALMYAIDRAAIVEAMFPNGDLTDTFVPAGYGDYWAEATKYEYNPEKAKQLLAEAGWDPNQELKIRYYYSDQLTLDMMDLIVYYLGEVGVKANHAFLNGDATSLIYETRDHDIVYKGLSAFGYEEAYGEMTSDGNIMTYLVNDDVFDALYAELCATTDAAARTEIIKKLQQLDQEYLYRLPLFSLQNCIVVNTNKVKTAGIYGNEWWNYDRNFAAWDIVE